MEFDKFGVILIVVLIDIVILIISEILIKKYLTKKMMFPKTRLIKSPGVTNDDLDINNSIFLHRTVGVIVVIQDITEHVKLDNMRKEFIADVSHELKTPITSIMGYADTLLEEEYDKETQSKFLSVIASEARRMAKLVTDLLTLSKNDSNTARTQKELFDLGELVKKCQDKLAIEIKKKNHEVKCFVTADVPPVYADKEDIERVVLNILTNSIKYTKDNGEIKILFSTTVIEVGIDNPNATVILIEGAERFGLSQLHQLRGRVGRGDKLGYCYLIIHCELNDTIKERINIICETTDGFKISEKDLELRGSGEFLGDRQSGIPDFKIGNIVKDGEIMRKAKDEMRALLKSEKEKEEFLKENEIFIFKSNYLKKSIMKED